MRSSNQLASSIISSSGLRDRIFNTGPIHYCKISSIHVKVGYFSLAQDYDENFIFSNQDL